VSPTRAKEAIPDVADIVDLADLADIDLPEGWEEVTLADLAVHVLGGEWGQPDTPEAPDRDSGGVRVRVLRGTEFRDWERSKGRTAALRRLSPKRLERRRLEVGDLVVEISGGGVHQPVGRVLRIDEAALAASEVPLVCSNFCRQVRLRPGVSSAYVQLALTERYLAGAVDAFQTQTTNLRNLDFPAFLNRLAFPLPPLAEQERIAARAAQLLARTARVRDRLAQVRTKVRRMRQAVLAAACSGRLTADWRSGQSGVEPFFEILARRLAARGRRFEADCRAAAAGGQKPPRRPRNLVPGTWEAPEALALPDLPAGWALVALGDVLERVQQGTSVRSEARSEEERSEGRSEEKAADGIPVLRMPNIQEGEIDLRNLKYVPPEAADLASFRLHPGDILFNRTNSPELVGKAAVFESDLQAIFASYLLRLICDERLVVPRYVCFWINSPWGRAWARAVRTDCVSQSNINGSKLLALPLPAPPLAEQREIVRRIEALFALVKRTEERLAAAVSRVERLPRTILCRALEGDLVPQEAPVAIPIAPQAANTPVST
jgi:type I restriction enzyme S subunit